LLDSIFPTWFVGARCDYNEFPALLPCLPFEGHIHLAAVDINRPVDEHALIVPETTNTATQ
jgi:hypothetical protein